MNMYNPIWYLLQGVAYAGFALFIGYFSHQPAYQHHDPDKALIKVSFSHAGLHKEECRRLSPEEIAQLAPNMRRPVQCNRERVPLLVEIVMDETVLLREFLPPSGLAKDGVATVYRRFPVAAGKHTLTARLRDSRREQGFDHEYTQEVELSPKQNFVIDFRPETGGFIFL